jgi:hypothetical protein
MHVGGISHAQGEISVGATATGGMHSTALVNTLRLRSFNVGGVDFPAMGVSSRRGNANNVVVIGVIMVLQRLLLKTKVEHPRRAW